MAAKFQDKRGGNWEVIFQYREEREVVGIIYIKLLHLVTFFARVS